MTASLNAVIRAGFGKSPILCRDLERRNPRLLFRFDGELLLRFADRQFLALLFQLPPRLTRFEPDTAVILM